MIEDGEVAIESRTVLVGYSDLMSESLKREDIDAIRLVPWSQMRPIADRGIDDKVEDQEVGAGVATSIRLQLKLFGETIVELQEVYR